jgi:uncharacterized protein (TIGR02001 family)
MKKILLASLIMAAFGSAHAQVAGLSGNLSLTTDYRFRGISQTQNGAAVQGGVDYAHKSGFYVGNWNSSVSSELFPTSAGIESDLYLGFKKEVYKGLTIDVGTMNYVYSRASSFGTSEIYAGVGYGPVSVKVSQSLSNYFGVANSVGSRYYQADLAQPVTSKITLGAHVGRTYVNDSTSLDYTDYRVGASYDAAGWVFGGHFYTNNNYGGSAKSAMTVSGQSLYKNTVVLSVAKSF